MNKSPIVILMVLLLPLTLSAHGEKNPWSLSGIVVEKQAGHIIEGAVISIEKNGQVLQSVATDRQGRFCLRFEGNVSRMDHLKIKIYKKGYKVETYLPVDFKDDDFEILLDKRVAVPLIRSTRGEPVFAI